MTRCAHRGAWLLVGAVALALSPGCDTTQHRAKQEATLRWNQARAQVKARLAADQFEAGNVDAAAAELAQADRLNPDDPRLAALRVRVSLARGEVARAAQLLEQTRLEGRPQAEIEYLLGVVRQQQERWDDALAAFLRAVGINPEEVAYVVAAAQAWLQLGQPRAALEFLEGQALRFGWTNAYQAALAECHEQVGDWAAAASAWQRVACADNDRTGIRERLAVALYRAGRYGEAIPVFEELLKEGAGQPDGAARLMLAECYLPQGQTTAAREQVQMVLQRDQNNLPALRLLARTWGAVGEYGSALRAAQRALSVAPRDVGTLELAAALAWRAGDDDLAGAMAARLLELDAQNPVARHVLQQAAQPTPLLRDATD